MARNVEQLLNDLRFLQDAVAFTRDMVEGFAQALPDDPAKRLADVDVVAQFYTDMEKQATNLDGPGDGSKPCFPPGPCDAPVGNTVAYLGALKLLSEHVIVRLNASLEDLKGKNDFLDFQIFPQRKLEWKSDQASGGAGGN